MWRTVIKICVSIALMWLVLRQQDLAALLRQITAMNLGALFAALALFAGLTAALALRWTAVLKALGAPLGLAIAFPIVMIGLFFSQALPSGVGGDIARAWLARNRGLPLSVAVSSVMVDRLSGILALLILVTVALPELFFISPGAGVTAGTVLVVVAGYAGLVLILLLDRLPQTFDRFRLARGLRQFAKDNRAAMLHLPAAIPILGYSFVNQIGIVLVIFTLASGLGLSVSISACLLIVPLANLVQSIPISIAGWGVRESFFVAAFGFVGVAPAKALALSVLFGVLTLVVSVPGGVIWLMQKRQGQDQSMLKLKDSIAEPGK